MGSPARQTPDEWKMVHREATHHINYVELLAAFLALQCFAKHSSRVMVQMKTNVRSTDLASLVKANIIGDFNVSKWSDNTSFLPNPFK